MIRRWFMTLVAVSVGLAAGYSSLRRTVRPEVSLVTADEFGSRVLPAVEFHADTLGEMVEKLRSATNTNIYVDWLALAQEQMYPHTPALMDISLHNVTMRQFLDRVSLSTTHNDVFLDWNWTNGLLTWTPVEHQSKDYGRDYFDGDANGTETRVYDVSSLLLSDRWQQHLRMPSGKPPAPCTTPDDRAGLLYLLIQSLIDTDSWRDVGGTTGSMSFYLGNLVVTQTPANQRAIYKIIQILREAR